MNHLWNRPSRQLVLLALCFVPPIAACSPSPNASPPPNASPSPNASPPPNASLSPNGTSPASPVASARSNPQLRVMTTFLPVYLFTKAVAGNAAQVSLLIPPGTEIHEYQSTPADVQKIAQSDLIVMNGLGIEGFLDNTMKSAQNPKLKVIDASEKISVIKDEAEHPDTSGKAHDHDHANGNPHVWLDPVLAKQQVEAIRNGLVAADPANKSTYEANAAAYLRQLDDLNQKFENRLNNYRDRTFITFHDAFRYLAKRYQLKQVAIVEIPEDQLSPTDVKTAIDAVKQYQAKALLSEPGVDNKLINGLSQDLKVQVRSIDSLENGQPDPQYYFTAMTANLETLEAAFK